MIYEVMPLITPFLSGHQKGISMQTLRLGGTHYGHVTASGNMQLIVVLVLMIY